MRIAENIKEHQTAEHISVGAKGSTCKELCCQEAEREEAEDIVQS